MTASKEDHEGDIRITLYHENPETWVLISK